MIIAFLVGLIAYIALVMHHVPSKFALVIAVVLFFCTLPFACIFGAMDNRADREERGIKALETMARNSRRRPKRPRSPERVPHQGEHSTVYKDDRAVIIDNRQVNIYNGEKPKEK